MNEEFLSHTKLFAGIAPEDIATMFGCLDPREHSYKRDERILTAGQQTDRIGLVLEGSVRIVHNDLFGNRHILGCAAAGQPFAEAFACMPGEPLGVSVEAAEDCRVLFLPVARVMTPCSHACSFHSKLIHNLLADLAAHNLELTRKMNHVTRHTIRERVLSYLSACSLKQGGYIFEIPFNRQQLADYLCVDRSALSNELSKMRAEGILDYDRNSFRLLKTPER